MLIKKLLFVIEAKQGNRFVTLNLTKSGGVVEVST